ncbi:MAG: hypothetical protein SGILL_000745 [Bacillariaceae sp.]
MVPFVINLAVLSLLGAVGVVDAGMGSPHGGDIDYCLPENAVAYYSFDTLEEGPTTLSATAVNLADPGTNDAVSQIGCRSADSIGEGASAAIAALEACAPVVTNPSSDLTDLGLAGNEDFSVQFWAKTDDFAAGNNLGFVALASQVDNAANNQWYFGCSPGNVLQLSYRGNSAFQDVQGPSCTTCVDGDWCHIAIVVRQTDSEVDFYINGMLEVTASGDLPQFGLEPATNLGLFIGSNPPFENDPTTEFNGLIDEVGIYDVVLDEDDVAALFNNGMGCPEPTPQPSRGKKGRGNKGGGKKGSGRIGTDYRRV